MYRSPISRTKSAAPKSYVAALIGALRASRHRVARWRRPASAIRLCACGRAGLPARHPAPARSCSGLWCARPAASRIRSARCCARLRPRIVHLHARTAAVSEALVDAAQTGGSKSRVHLPYADRQLRPRHDDVDGPLDVRRQAGSAPLQRLHTGGARYAAAAAGCGGLHARGDRRHGRAYPMGRARRRRATPAGPDRGGASRLPRHDAQG